MFKGPRRLLAVPSQALGSPGVILRLRLLSWCFFLTLLPAHRAKQPHEERKILAAFGRLELRDPTAIKRFEHDLIWAIYLCVLLFGKSLQVVVPAC